MGRPQSLINEDLKDCDYFVLILWDRWGSPSGDERYTSATSEEYSIGTSGSDVRRVLREPSSYSAKFAKRPAARWTRNNPAQSRGACARHWRSWLPCEAYTALGRIFNNRGERSAAMLMWREARHAFSACGMADKVAAVEQLLESSSRAATFSSAG
jgi:hypothetical protein